MPRRAFLAWEIGSGGRGHVVKLAIAAQKLKHRGFTACAYLTQLDHAAEITPYCERVDQAPLIPKRNKNAAQSGGSSFLDWLTHFSVPNAARSTIALWRDRIIEARPSVVVADLAPSVLLAARSLDLPTIRIGVPANTPPAEMPEFPPYLPEMSPPHHDQVSVRDSINEAIAAFGLPLLPTLPAISFVDDDIVASIELLDRYAAWRDRPRVPPVVGDWQEPGERRRDEVFVYLSDRERFRPVVLTAIASLDLPLRILVAGNTETAAKAVSWRNAKVETRPLAPKEIVRRARVLVHGGGHGISCLGVRGGIPQVTFPDHAERTFTCRQLASKGTEIVVERPRWTVPNIQTAIREAWEGTAMTDRAISIAKELAPEFEGDPAEMIADRIEAVLC